MEQQNFWRRCSSCKKEIQFGKAYQECEVSNCRKHAFCSVSCWNLLNEVMNHKSAGAIERIAPFTPDVEASQPKRILVNPNNIGGSAAAAASTTMDHEILIVASKLKQYIKEKHDLNTSANVMEALSDKVRRLADDACEKAKMSGRKTVMDRDFE